MRLRSSCVVGTLVAACQGPVPAVGVGEVEANVPGAAKAAEAPVEASPSVDLVELTEALRVCDEDGHPLGEVVEAEALALGGEQRVFLARMGNEQVLLFQGETVYGCGAFVIDTPAATVEGDWFGEGRSRTVELFSQRDDGVPCDSDACPIALVVREDDAIVAAVRPDLACETVTLTPVKLFDGRDSLELRCVAGGGADASETLWIGHAFERAMQPVLVADVGLVFASPSKGDRVCTRRWTGGWRIVRTGATPVVEVVEVDFDDLGKGSKATWTYAAQEQTFVPDTAEVVELRSKRTCA